MADQNLQTLYSYLKRNDTKLLSGETVVSYSHDHGEGPILCMVHGWPQSSYTWRHTIPLLKDKISLFIPDLPGYGISSLPSKHDKRTVGKLVIAALQQVYNPHRPVIWCGHDRGARVGHRLLVDQDPTHNLRAAVLLDIIPTLEQWRGLDNPVASVAYYHWPFLATPTAPRLIELMGGREFCLDALTRTQGADAAGVAKLKANDAFEHYAHWFDTPNAIVGSCGDYAAGARGDVDEQRADQEAGRKIELPTMLVYSKSNLGSQHDVEGIWRDWVQGELDLVGVPGGIGHYIPEEAPEVVADLVIKWIDRHISL